MKTLVVTLSFSLLASALTGWLVYDHTRNEWQREGHRRGMIAGADQILRSLDGFATKGAPPREPDLAIDFRDRRLSILRDDAGLELYSE